MRGWLSIAIVLLVFFQPVHCAAADPPEGVIHAAIAAHVIAQFADVSTTEFAIGSGRFKEANPLVRWGVSDPVKIAILKGAFATGTSYVLLKIHKQHPWYALGVSAALTGIGAYAAGHNRRALVSAGLVK